MPEWREYLDSESGSDGAITARLEGYEKLGTDLGIRTRPAAIVSGPRGTRTLQDGPSLAADGAGDRSGAVTAASAGLAAAPEAAACPSRSATRFEGFAPFAQKPVDS